MLREYGLDNKYVTTDDDTVYQLLSKRALERPDELIAQFKDPQTNQWSMSWPVRCWPRCAALRKA